MSQKSDRCFCAFCKSPRSVYGQKHISFFDAILAAIASTTLSWLIWQDIDPRALMFFGFGLGVAELFVIFRRRLSIACPKCGFDLLLYRRNPQLAADRVKEFRLQRMEDPLWVFSPPPQMPSQTTRSKTTQISADLNVSRIKSRQPVAKLSQRPSASEKSLP